MTFLLALLLSSGALGQEANLTYTDTNSVQALRNLELLAGKKPTSKQSETELAEWVRARFAWIALLRLEGKSEDALKVFEGCGSYCAKHGPSAEWKSLKAWGCGRKMTASPCK